MNLIIFGAPGAGKGTQAEAVSEYLGIPTISAGQMIRQSVKQGTALGIRAKSFMEAGKLVPDEVVISIITERLAHDDCHNGFILDGFPRTVQQAEVLDAMGIKIDRVIDIEVPDATIQKRLSGRRICESCGASYHIHYKPSKVSGVCDRCGGATVLREDDHPDTVKARLSTYHRETEPLRGYYEKTGKLSVVEGQEKVEDTTSLTIALIGG
jgi:adenylate kinase